MKKVLSMVLALAMILCMMSFAAAEDVVTLRFSNWDGGETKDAYDAAIAKFEALHPNIKVENLYIPDEYDTKLMAMVASGTAPDVAILESSTIAFTLAEEGKVYNIADMLAADPEYKSNVLDVLTYRWEPDKIMGYALGPQVCNIFVSTTAFENAGLTYPTTYEESWTWDEFVEVCQKLTLDGNGRNALDPEFNKDDIIQYGVNVPTWNATGYSILMGSMGGEFTNPEGTALAIFDEPYMADSIQKLVDLIYVYNVAPSPTVKSSLPGMVDSFLTGAYAMSMGGHWSNLTLMQESVPYDLAPYPVFDKPYNRLMGGCLSIMSETKHPKEAWEFYKFLLDPENTLSLLDCGLWMPMEQDWYTEPELIAKWAGTEGHPAGYTGIIVEGMLKYAQPLWQFSVKNYNKMEELINAAMDDVWLGQISAADALAGVKDDVTALFVGCYDK